MSEYIPFNITTDAGKELWREMNQHYGSVVWGRVGDGIEAVEAEMRERIIKLLEQQENREKWIYATRNTVGTYSNTVEFLVSLIKGENK